MITGYFCLQLSRSFSCKTELQSSISEKCTTALLIPPAKKQPMPTQDTNHKSNNFDFLRIVAALIVLFSHQYALTGFDEPKILGTHTLGTVGVLIFFTISGFLVTQSWLNDPHIIRFATKRFLRIWPGFAVAIALCTFALGPAVTKLSLVDYLNHPGTADYFFKNLQFSLRDVLPLNFDGNALPTAINGSLWTIPLEIQCYAILALLGISKILNNRWPILIATIFFGLLYVSDLLKFSSNTYWPKEYYPLLEFGLYFFSGSIIYLFAKSENLATAAILLWLVGALAAYANMSHLFFLLTIPITVILIGQKSIPYLNQTGRFGDVSYGIYIYAFPVQQVVVWRLQHKVDWWLLLATATLITIILALLSWHFIEKWALKLKPQTPINNM